MEGWAHDKKVLWKAAVIHHPLWGNFYPDIDFANLVANFLPLLKDHKFDLYFNGHEHIMSYSTFSY